MKESLSEESRSVKLRSEAERITIYISLRPWPKPVPDAQQGEHQASGQSSLPRNAHLTAEEEGKGKSTPCSLFEEADRNAHLALDLAIRCTDEARQKQACLSNVGWLDWDKGAVEQGNLHDEASNVLRARILHGKVRRLAARNSKPRFRCRVAKQPANG